VVGLGFVVGLVGCFVVCP